MIPSRDIVGDRHIDFDYGIKVVPTALRHLGIRKYSPE
jgi:hypothetical protein